LSGEDLAAADPSASFFDLGLDSLFLTQAAQSLRKKFNIKISFRQLLDDLSAFAPLVDYIDTHLPAGHLSSTASPAPAAPAALHPSPPQRFGPYKPIDRSASAAFTPAQQSHLDSLIARYTARTPKSKSFTQAHRARFADPRAVAGFRPFWKEMVYPIVAQRSQGARIWDIDGNEYVDVTMGFGTNLFGHSPDFVTDALRRQLDDGVEVGPGSPLAGEVAELFCDLTGNERVTFCSTGSEAILGAIRLARTVTGRTKIATTSEAYHGICDEVLVRSAGGRPQPIAPGIPAHAVSEVLILDWGNPASLDLLRAHAHELAAVLVESVQSRRPEIQPVEFIREIRRITQESGTAFILDEVITGFRAHPGGVQALWNIRADMVTYGKVIGGGMPIGAIGGRAEYMDALDGGSWQFGDASFPGVGVTFFAGTYVRHPLAMAAAKAVLEHLRDAGPALQLDLAERTASFTAELNAFFDSEGAPIRATHFTSMMYFQFGEAFRHPGLLFFHLREKGLHIWEGRPWFLSTAHTEADIQFILRVFRETILELKQSGFLGEVPAAPPVLALPPAESHPVNPVNPVRISTPKPAEPAIPSPAITPAARAPLFSVYFFGSYPPEYSPSKYRLLIEATRLADTRGFHAVWLPERHFHPVGGFSPNPSLLAAALARETTQIRLHGGSVVVPLHHPVRIAEEWSLVDNLSNGRAGISFASGWHPNDFIFAPGNFENRRDLYYQGIDLIRRLWRGESANFQTGAAGRIDIQIHPRPCQPELPTWFTCIHRDAFVKAGELGANVLCHTVNQSLDEIAGKVAAYRQARARAGFDPGHVTLLVHTFLAADAAQAVEQARQPFYDYLASFLDNGKKKAESHGRQIDLAPEDMDEIQARSYADYVENKALIGSVESCSAVIDKLTAIGIDELGCFIDFGVAPEAVLSSLDRVAQLKDLTKARHAGPLVPSAPLVLSLPRSQRGLWTLLNTGESASRVYNESITLALHGPANADALRQSLQFLIDRHEALRALVSPDGDSQQILPHCPIDLETRDFSTNHNGTRDAGVRAFFSQREAALFDFARPPLLRASLAIVSPREHLLLLTFHHLVGNGPSYTMFLDELAAAYDAFARGVAPQLPPALQLHDFVAWRAAQEANQDDSAQFWLDQFSGIVPVLDLPADHPRPAVQTFVGGREILALDEPLTKALKAAAAGQRCSLFMLLFTAYEVLLHRLSGQDDLVIGVAADAEIRTEEGGQSLFANTTHMMPLRCRIAPAASFPDQLRASKDLILDASEHQQYFFGDLIGRLRLPRDLSRSPLFSVTFNLETGEFRKRAGGIDFEWATDPQPYRSPAGTAMFDLYMNVAERNGGLLCELDHSEIFDPETAARWLAHFRTLLGQIAQNPAAQLSALTLLDSSGKVRLATDRPYPADALLHRLVEQQAARTPNAVAVSFGPQSLTYAALNDSANRLARSLRAVGVRREVPVAVCLERSLELPVALLAVLKAGGAYVPIDPGYPAERVHFMLRDSAAPVVLATDDVAARFRTQGGPRFIDPAAASAGDPAPNPVDLIAGADDLAYILYTSGSTGVPKGSMISHRAICNHMFWMQEEFPLAASDRVLQKTPLPFDASVWEFWAPLIAGARLVIAPPGVHRDSRELTALVQREAVTILQLVPSMAALVADETGLPRCVTLRRLFCGGEPLTPELCEKFFARLPGCEVINLYGPTECAIDTVFHRCLRGASTVPIGRPVANTRLYVLDSDGAPVPPGARGILHIAGVQLARGYWNNPTLTAAKFIHLHGERLYKTGDLVRLDDQGRLEYLGRSDEQIKIRGQRIEPAEIEAVLKRQPGVRDCAVIARADEAGGKRLVAYVVPDRSNQIELWPSSPSAGGEQFFDEALYRAMTNDHLRNERFRQAFERTVRDKVVVDIGCGKDAILSRLCIEAGARKVHAIELLAPAADQARALIEKMRLTERIVVLQGDVRSLQLPELADVCVSENIGHVGGAEGWDLVLAKAAHLLKPGAPMIPRRCETLAAAVSLPEYFMRHPKFSELAAYYAGNLFTQAGYQFDLRLSITGTDRSNLRSTIGVFEDIDFQNPRPWYSSALRLTIDETSLIHGLLLWVRIEMAPGIVLDTIDNQASWLPVFLPVFPAGLAVEEGDIIEAEVTGALAENGLNRDYAIHGSVTRAGQSVHNFDFTSWHYKRVFKATPFYETLFASGELPIAPSSRALASSTLSHALAAALPPAMVPSAFVVIPALPLLPNGKLDRNSLPAPGPQRDPAADFAAPVTSLQKQVAEIWKRVLNLDRIGLHDNFFEIGGDSLTGLRVINRLRELLNEHVSLVVIFEAPTLERLSQLLERNYAEAVQRWLGIRPQDDASELVARIDEADVATLRSLVTPLPKFSGSGPKNPPAIFILSPMRSGSTLLRIMLAGNPRLFAPPELQLLGFENLAARNAAFTGYDKYLHEGVIRAVMEILRCEPAEAESIIAGTERGDIKLLYAHIQQWIAPRLLVDKTPDYAMDIDVLRRAEDLFEDPLYIHLTRHPLGMIRSYEKGRFILESLFRGRHDFTARQLAELTWLISHRNITEFLHGIPAHRQQRVRFEDLVSTPLPVLGGLCQWLEIPFMPEMADPYQGGSERMTDGVHPMSPQVGDANFYKHGRLNPEVASSWKNSYTEDFLSPLTWVLAASFGYPNPFAAAKPARLHQPISRLSRDRRRVSGAAL
jgi:amino acid adenylation domain-containing protein/natural product biosynthesis luciferase-like monooxygenase protein